MPGNMYSASQFPISCSIFIYEDTLTGICSTIHLPCMVTLKGTFPVLAMSRPSLTKLHPHIVCVGIDRSLNSITINFQKTIQVKRNV
jgi:hypothetical protein